MAALPSTKGDETMRKWLGEQGSVLILTAILIPLLLGCTGLVIDGGNYYLQKSRLQNAADAAVLAGANRYAQRLDLNSLSDHKDADRVAQQYVTGIYHNLSTQENLGEDYNAGTADGTVDGAFDAAKDVKTGSGKIYYRVRLTKPQVKLYFLSALGIAPKDVSAESVAVIRQADDFFLNKMFIFSDVFTATNSMANPDNLSAGAEHEAHYHKDATNMITNTFDGGVACTDGTGNTLPADYIERNKDKVHITYSTQVDGMADKKNWQDVLYTQAAQDRNKTEALGSIDEDIAAAFGRGQSSPYGTRAEALTYDYTKFLSFMKNDIASGKKAMDKDVQEIALSDSAVGGQDVFVLPASTPNLTVSVQSTLTGTAPLYIYVPEDAVLGNINIDLAADTGRPIVLCVASKKTKSVHLNLKGHTYNGIIYAPYLDPQGDGLQVNASGGSFVGTLVGSKIDLRNDPGHYSYKNWLKDIYRVDLTTSDEAQGDLDWQ